MIERLPRVKKVTYTAMVIALAVSLRIIKYSLFGSVQFVNFPAVFTIIGGALLGPSSGLAAGLTTYILSDIMIGLPGPWTIVNSVLMGGVGFLSGLIWGRNSVKQVGKLGLAVGSYIMLLAFDITNSWALLVIMGFDWFSALIVGIVGLFLPAAGGYLYGVGPITELTTVLLIVTIVSMLKKNGFFLKT
ncbi:MAG: ECF transporter S component [Candidatus Methanomethyliales bacterium]|nr:ECF transporter S component [Candidatus Methanomethylicales archaeon]